MRRPGGRSALRLALILFVAAAATARVAWAAPGESACGGPWESYTFGGEEFSVALPEMPALDHVSRFVKGSRSETEPARLYAAYGDGAVYLLRAYDRPRPHEDADFFARYFALTYDDTDAPVPLAAEDAATPVGFFVRRYALAAWTPRHVSASSLRVFLTRKHAYALRVVGADDAHPCARRFFDSFKLSDSPSGRRIVDDSKALEVVKDTPPAPPRPAPPDIRQALEGDPKAKAGGEDGQRGRGFPGPGGGVGKVEGGTGGAPAAPSDHGRVFTMREVTRKAVLVSRPEPPYTERARKNQVTGVVALRLVLSADGKVSGISLVSRLPDGLTQKAILAARHLKFIPAEKDGRRVAQYVTIHYNFKIY